MISLEWLKNIDGKIQNKGSKKYILLKVLTWAFFNANFQVFIYKGYIMPVTIEPAKREKLFNQI